MPEKRLLSVEDLNRIQMIESPAISPDGTCVAYVVVTPDPMGKGYKRNLWLVSTNGTHTPHQITFSGKDNSPRWSPDGKMLAFVSGRGKKSQIYLLPTAVPGEARQLTNLPNGASTPRWSPDGKMLAFLAPMNADERATEDKGEEISPPADELESQYREDRQKQDNDTFFDPLHVWKIPFRAAKTYRDGRYQQLYITSLDEEAKPYRLTDLDVNYGEPEWSPDGKFIFVHRQFDHRTDEAWRGRSIFKINVADGTEERLLDEKHGTFNPLPSPDGKWIACIRMFEGATDLLPLFSVIPAEGGEAIDLNRELDRSVYNAKWTADNQLIAAVASEGRGEIYRFNPVDQTYEALMQGEIEVSSLDITASGDIAFAASTPQNPSELYFQKVNSSEPQKLTTLNQEFLDEVIVQPVQEIRFQSDEGMEIQGWYLLPVGYEEGKQYPLALNIHGGPHAMWGASTASMWHEWQYHAAAGYVVFYSNPRGSDGYGNKHLRDLHAEWGNIAMVDVMAGIDAMIEKEFVDANRMAVTGGSYGGYMTGWIVGHTDRFKAAVAQRGVFNLVSFYGTSDIPYFMETEYDGLPWRDHERMWQHSPVAHAHKVKTPLLIIHAENDFRVPIEQGEQMFAIVHRATDTPVEMLRFPREGHEMSRTGEPNHRISRLTEMVNWFDKYCK